MVKNYFSLIAVALVIVGLVGNAVAIPAYAQADCDSTYTVQADDWLSRIADRFLGDVLERWLQKYQITKHTRLAGQNGAYDTLLFTPDICKGHYDGHKHKTMLAYQQRVEKFEKW